MSRTIDRPEEEWAGASAGELAELRRQVLELGESAAFANGLIGHVVGLADDQPVSTAEGTLARYRRVLRELGPPAARPPAARRRNARARARGQRGLAEVRALTGAAGGMATAALCAAAGRPGLALVLAPIIPDASSEAPTAPVAVDGLAA